MSGGELEEGKGVRKRKGERERKRGKGKGERGKGRGEEQTIVLFSQFKLAKISLAIRIAETSSLAR